MDANDEDAEAKKVRTERLKATLDAELKEGKISGVEYNKRVISLVVPEEKHKKILPRPKPTVSLIILIVAIIILLIPVAINLNWHYYFKNTLTANGVPDYGGVFKSSMKSPLQIDLQTVFSETGEYKGRPIKINYKAYYDISGVITSIKDYWGFSAFDTLSPRDFCMIWGKLAEQYPSSEMEFHHGERYCSYNVPSQFLNSRTGTMGSTHYGSSLVSNNHLIPSTAEIRDQLAKLNTGDKVRIVGYLVDVDYDGVTLNSSMTRDDIMFDRNSGTCEIIYVTKVEKLE